MNTKIEELFLFLCAFLFFPYYRFFIVFVFVFVIYVDIYNFRMFLGNHNCNRKLSVD